MKFIEECVMCIEKHVLYRKMLTNGQKIGLPLQARVEKTVHGITLTLQ